MVAPNPSAVEDATEYRPNRDSRLSHVEEKNRAADETSTQPPAQTVPHEPSERVIEAGIAAGEKPARGAAAAGGGSSSRAHHVARPSSGAAAEKKEIGSSPRPSIQTDFDDDDVNPADFQGEVLTNDELPSPETVRRIEDYIVLDKHGKTHTFKSLYTGRNVARRVLIIFVRHFFCGVSLHIVASINHDQPFAPPPPHGEMLFC